MADSGKSERATSQEAAQRPYLKFGYPNVGYVIDGEEDATVRVGLERGFEVGQRIQLRTPNNNVFGYAEIEDVYEARVSNAWSDMVFVDDRNHPASSNNDLRERLGKHYENIPITFDTDVTVIYFDLIQVGGAR